jgi:hypothetical protein
MLGGCVGLCIINQHSSYVEVAVCLALTGIGAGLYNSPNTSQLMISANPRERGLVASLNVMVAFFMAMISITIAFKLILGGIPLEALTILFLYLHYSKGKG